MAAVVIEPSRGWRRLRVSEIWRSRELLYFLVWRDIKVRYKQTAFGIAWAVLQPFVLMVVFSLFLGRLHRFTEGGIPYPLFVYSGLVPWTFFSQSLSMTAGTFVQNQTLVSKIYFPRLLLPLASIGSFLLDFAISFVLLIGLMAYYGAHPTAAIAFLPAFILLDVMTVLGVGIFLSALNVRYRDVKYAVTSMLLVWLFLSPVVYPAAFVPSPFRLIYGLNPMAGVVNGFRWALLGNPTPGPMVAVSAAISIVLIAAGLAYFKRVEREFADVI